MPSHGAQMALDWSDFTQQRCRLGSSAFLRTAKMRPPAQRPEQGDQEGPARRSSERLFLCQMSKQITVLCAAPLDLIFRLKRLKRIMKLDSKEDGLEIIQKALSQSELLELSEDGMRIQKKDTAGVCFVGTAWHCC